MIETLERRNVAALATTHRLVGFGAGELGERTLRFFGGHVGYFIDNDRQKWGDSWRGGVPVRPIEALRTEDPERLIVIMCTEHAEAAARQIDAVLPGARVVQTPLLRDHGVFDGLLACTTRLLVSAYGAAGGLYLVDAAGGTHQRLVEGSFRGMTVAGGELIVATERGDLAVVRGLDPLRLETRYRADGVSQAHGLAYWAAGHHVLVAEAHGDTIGVHDASTLERVDELPIAAAPGEADRHHVNDLLVVGDRLLATVLSARGWWQYGVYDGAVLEMDLRAGGGFRPMMSELCFPHSIRLIDDRLCLLEAMTGALRIGGRKVAMQFAGFTRGLAGTTRCLYVGQSRHRRLADARARVDAISMDGGIYVADVDARVFRFVKLPDWCDVYDLLDLDSCDAVSLDARDSER